MDHNNETTGSRKRSKRIALRVLLGMGILLATAALCVYIWVKFNVCPPETPVTTEPVRSGVYTFLLVGRDTASGNTDTMVLLTFDHGNKRVKAMSLPRDTMVNVSWRNKKLNTVYNASKGKDKDKQVETGMRALREQVGKLTGIVPDFYVTIEWDAVGRLVDTVGGVDFYVPYDMNYDDPEQDLHIHQKKGQRRLSGKDAMEVIRWRKNNGEYGNFQVGDAGRMKIQQNFLTAVIKECLQVKNLTKFPDFADIFTENVETNLTVGNLVWFAQEAMGMNVEQDVSFQTMPYTNYSRGTAYVLPDVEAMLAILNDGINPYESDITIDDLEVIQRRKDGSLYLTSGAFADPSLEKNVSASPKPSKPQDQPNDEPQDEPEPLPEPEPEPEPEPIPEPEPDVTTPDEQQGENEP